MPPQRPAESTRCRRPADSDIYWPYFNKVVLRANVRPDIPWAEIKKGGSSGFDVECHGATTWDKAAGISKFKKHSYLLYETPNGKHWEATRDAKYAWSVKKH